MEQYRKLLAGAALPSCALFFTLTGAVMAGHSSINEFPGYINLIPGAAAVIIFLSAQIKLLRGSPAGPGGQRIIKALLLAGACCGGGLSVYHRCLPVPPSAAGDQVPGFEAEVISAKRGRDSLSLVLNNSGPAPFKAAAWTKPDTEIYAGDTLLIKEVPEIIEFRPREISGFDLSLLRRGITRRTYLHENNFQVIARGERSLPLIRQKLSGRIESLFSAESAALFKGLWFGDRSFISKKTISSFRRAGVLHTLAASGMHVGVLVMIPFSLGALFTADRRLLHCAGLAVLTLYLLLADSPVSLTRAFIMYSAYSAAVIFSLKPDPLNSLFIAASAIVIIEPSDIYSLGFLLSFSAVLGIITFFNLFKSSFRWMPGPLSNSIAMTMSAQIFTTPIIYLWFEEINLTGIISNLAVIPAIGLLLASSIFTAMISFISHEAALLAALPVEALYISTEYFIDFMASLGGHFYSVNSEISLLLLILAWNLPVLPLKRGREILSLISVTSLAVLWLYLSAGIERGPKLIFFSGRASTAGAYIHSGRCLISGEIPGPAGARFIAEILNREQVDDSDIVITRGGADQIAGYLVLAKLIPVSNCYIDPEFEMGYRTFSLFSVFEREGVHVVIKKIHGHESPLWPPVPQSPFFIEEASALMRPGSAVPLTPLYVDLPPEKP